MDGNVESKIPPFLVSEVSSRLLKTLPELRKLFNAEEVKLSGKEFEMLLVANYLIGFTDGMNEGADYMEGKATTLIDWTEKNG